MLRPFSMIYRGLAARRSHPDLAYLAAESDPEQFVWAVLPHAARSFAASIVVLPRRQARVAAVAYLYARMLDTYEDLLPDPTQRPPALRAFAERLGSMPPRPPLPIPDHLAVDERDRLHLLLVERAHLVDEVFATLGAEHRAAIIDMVCSMADGMAWSTERFAAQGGVLVDDGQLLQYCRNVIGYPALFAISLVHGRSEHLGEDALVTSEMIQLANITRDIEKDLARGIAYDPRLRDHLGCEAPDAIREVRRRLTVMALNRADAYRRLYEGIDLRRRAGSRLAAVLMLLFTDRHYRRMARSIGRRPWQGHRGKAGTVIAALPSLFSHRYASWTIRRVTGRLTAAADGLAA
jgi:phytoene/squalene synthetase